MGIAPNMLTKFRHSIFRASCKVSTHSNPYLAIAARALPQLDPAQVIHADVLSEYVSILLAAEFTLAEVRVLLAHSLDRLIRAREPWLVAAHFMDNFLLVLGRL
eukprot:3348821-Amphidinium_carterae.1